MFDAMWNPVIVYVLATVFGIWLKEVVGNRMQAVQLANLIRAELEYDKNETMKRLQKILSIPPQEFKSTLAKKPLKSFLSTFESFKSDLNLLPPDVAQNLFQLQKFHQTVFANFFEFFLEEMAKFETYEEELDIETLANYVEYLDYCQETVQQKIFIIEDLMNQLLVRLLEFQQPYYKKFFK
jgi:hypothetical protein